MVRAWTLRRSRRPSRPFGGGVVYAGLHPAVAGIARHRGILPRIPLAGAARNSPPHRGARGYARAGYEVVIARLANAVYAEAPAQLRVSRGAAARAQGRTPWVDALRRFLATRTFDIANTIAPPNWLMAVGAVGIAAPPTCARGTSPRRAAQRRHALALWQSLATCHHRRESCAASIDETG